MPTSWYLIQKQSSLRRKSVFTIVITFRLTWERNYAAQLRQLTCAETAFSQMEIFPGNQSGVNCGVSRNAEPSNRDLKLLRFHTEYGSEEIYDRPSHRGDSGAAQGRLGQSHGGGTLCRRHGFAWHAIRRDSAQ